MQSHFLKIAFHWPLVDALSITFNRIHVSAPDQMTACTCTVASTKHTSVLARREGERESGRGMEGERCSEVFASRGIPSVLDHTFRSVVAKSMGCIFTGHRDAESLDSKEFR